MFDYQEALKKVVPHLVKNKEAYTTTSLGFVAGLATKGIQGALADRKTYLNIIDRDAFRLLSGEIMTMNGNNGRFVVLSRTHVENLIKAASKGAE